MEENKKEMELEVNGSAPDKKDDILNTTLNAIEKVASENEEMNMKDAVKAVTGMVIPSWYSAYCEIARKKADPSVMDPALVQSAMDLSDLITRGF